MIKAVFTLTNNIVKRFRYSPTSIIEGREEHHVAELIQANQQQNTKRVATQQYFNSLIANAECPFEKEKLKVNAQFADQTSKLSFEQAWHKIDEIEQRQSDKMYLSVNLVGVSSMQQKISNDCYLKLSQGKLVEQDKFILLYDFKTKRLRISLIIYIWKYLKQMNQETLYNRLRESHHEENQVVELSEKKINPFQDYSCEEYYSLQNLIERGRQPKINFQERLTREEEQKLESLSEALKACYDLRKVIEDHQFGYFFKYPVNPHKLGLPNYWTIIKRPIDLTTIKRKFFIGLYVKASQFNQDMRLLFTNALTYNSTIQEIVSRTNQLFTLYQSHYSQIEKMIFQNKLSQRFRETTESSLIISKLPPPQVISIFNQTRLQKLGRLLSFLNNRKKRSLIASLKKKYTDLPIEEGQNQRLYFNRLTPDQIYELLKMAKNINDTDFEVAKLMKLQKELPVDNENWEKVHNQNQNKPQQQVQSQFQIQDEQDE